MGGFEMWKWGEMSCDWKNGLFGSTEDYFHHKELLLTVEF